jgi:predicted N-acetyltransferase YhbS
MVIRLRVERPEDFRKVEELTREAFWINTDHRPYIDEHYLVHKLRKTSAFVPELAYVAEIHGTLVGNIMYSKARIVTPEGEEHEVLTFGPLSVLPEFQGIGVGKALVLRTFEEAKKLGFRVVVIFGHPDYYPRFGFRRAGDLGITTSQGHTFPAFMVRELVEGALEGIRGRFFEDRVFNDLPEEDVLRFDEGFPKKAPREKVPMERLLDGLDPMAQKALRTLKLTYLGQMGAIAESVVRNLPGMNAKALDTIRSTMKEHGRIWGI